MASKGFNLTNSKECAIKVDISKCIICQTLTDSPLVSQERGRKRILEASKIRQDATTKRLKTIGSQNFSYHGNNDCYNKYTRRDLLAKEVNQSPGPSQVDLNNNNTTSTRSSSKVQPRAQPISANTSGTDVKYKVRCIICDQVKCNGERKKWRVSTDTGATSFLKATMHLQDDVYQRTCDLQDPSSVFGADLMYHAKCMNRYKKAFTNSQSQTSKPYSCKRHSFDTNIKDFDKQMKDGQGFELSVIRDELNKSIAQEDSKFRNRDVYMFLVQHYGNDIEFATNKLKNVSTICFLKHSQSTKEMAQEIYSKQNPVKECATILKRSLSDIDFDLDDRFADATDLENSWNALSAKIPTPLVEFFSIIFNFKPNEFYETPTTQDNDYDNETDEPNSIDQENHLTPTKKNRVLSMIQIMKYIMTNGCNRTPLHILNAQSIYEACRSSILISSFNRYGLCCSHDELLRYHRDMGKLIAKDGDDGSVPFPSNFNHDTFTTAAFDNFDHIERTISGINSTHDTVSVLVQEKNDTSSQKPKLSESGIVHHDRSFSHDLSCQLQKEYIKPVGRGKLPASYSVESGLFTMNVENCQRIKEKDTIWQLSRMHVDSKGDTIGINSPNQKIPSWKAFNWLVTHDTIPMMSIAFMPLLPFPVTEYSTVYTALLNFLNVLSKLSQSHLPVMCDEGVFHIAREIQLLNKDMFDQIILVLGSFHMAKRFMFCIGKYLKGSGADTILTESGCFGLNAVEAVFNGGNYARAIKGMFLLADAMERLRWKAFFEKNGTKKYEDVLRDIEKLRDATSDMNRQKAQNITENIRPQELMHDFETFCEDQNSLSQTCKYWSGFVEMVHLLRNLIRSDREGNWELHMDTVQQMLPYFAICDCTNYLRWGSIYFEDMRKLPKEAPEVYQAFLEGKFVVKRNAGRFNSVGGDMNLEQTINRSQKGPGGVIGSTKNKAYVTEWELIYHEMLAVTNLQRKLTNVRVVNHELAVNHEFTNRVTNTDEVLVQNIIEVIVSKENPFIPTDERRLHNILTMEIMTDVIAEDLLNIKQKGDAVYRKFREERFLREPESRVAMSDTIIRCNLKTQANIQDEPTKQTPKLAKKKEAVSTRLIDLARERGYDMEKLFEYDLTSHTNMLYDSEELMKKTEKSQLTRELMKSLEDDDFSFTSQHQLTTACIVDVMAILRGKLVMKKMKTFKDVCETFMNVVLKSSHNSAEIHLVFDTYKQGSIKDSERIRRTKKSPISLKEIKPETTIPVDMERFWPSGTNKCMIQLLIKDWFRQQGPLTCPDTTIVLSGIGGDEPSPCLTVSNGEEKLIQELDMYTVEEADIRMVPHIMNAIKKGIERIIVLSPDTDVLVLALHHFSVFSNHGLKQLWMKIGKGDSVKYVPIHTLHARIGDLAEVLPALHSLTGCDVTSKVGTKLSAIKASPCQYLAGFGMHETYDQENFLKAEEYLVHCFKSSVPCKTMNELRYWIHHHGKNVPVQDLPPTSYAILPHLKRAHLATYTQRHALSGATLNPRNFGFHEENETLVPDQNIRVSPNDLAPPCKCKACATVRCSCHINMVPCCKFCNCKSLEDDHCQNIMKTESELLDAVLNDLVT